jgi:hypothetical protein
MLCALASPPIECSPSPPIHRSRHGTPWRRMHTYTQAAAPKVARPGKMVSFSTWALIIAMVRKGWARPTSVQS